MSASSLFPNEAIAQDRAAPVLWIRRLVLVAERKPDVTPIREVSFRLGLNVIRTALPNVGETNPVGHSVGKTLLTRLIRYSLGETSYATRSVRNRIETLYPQGFVLAEFVVAGNELVVARPLRGVSVRESFMLSSSDFRAPRNDGLAHSEADL